MGKLDGKVALITGAARGQGAAEARLFAQEGARVVLGDVLDEPGKRVADEIGSAARYVHFDVTQPAAWHAAVEVARSAFGGLDVLVNNAGILKLAPVATMSLEDYLQVIQVNQIGTFLGIQAAVPSMRERGGGSIINISSVAGLTAAPLHGAYVSSKFAVRGLTKVAAIELGSAGIRVNSIHPGGVDTSMLEVEGVDPRVIRSGMAAVPLGRIGHPDEIARLALFLACDESSYCTGAEFVIDGGLTAGLSGFRLPQ